jgi:predicted secreted protein
MALPSHPLKFYVRSDATAPSATDEVAGLNNCDYSPNVDLLDVTDFKDTSGAKLKMAALTDGSITASGDALLSDTPQSLIRSSMLTGASVWVTIQFNPSGTAGQKGFQIETKVKNYKVKGSVAGKNEFDADFEFTGAPSLV